MLIFWQRRKPLSFYFGDNKKMAQGAENPVFQLIEDDSNQDQFEPRPGPDPAIFYREGNGGSFERCRVTAGVPSLNFGVLASGLPPEEVVLEIMEHRGGKASLENLTEAGLPFAVAHLALTHLSAGRKIQPCVGK